MLPVSTTAHTEVRSADRPREHFQNVTAIYDWVRDSHGTKLRTIATRPNNRADKVPVIFFVGWLSCDSVEYTRGETDAFGAIFWRLIETSGYATMRMDKPGVGESEGVCKRTDFLTELGGYRAAFDSLRKYQFIDLDRVFVVGLSNGGGTAPLVAQGGAVRGYIVASSWGRTWYEHMLELERVRLSNQGNKSPSEIDLALKQFTDFYSLFLIHKMIPGEITKQHPEWAAPLVRRARRPVRSPRRVLPATSGFESRRNLVRRECACPRSARSRRHHHEPCRQRRNREHRQPRAPRIRTVHEHTWSRPPAKHSWQTRRFRGA